MNRVTTFVWSLAVLTAGAVAAFGIYTWGWHDKGGLDHERARAELAAQEVAELCSTNGGSACTVHAVERVASDQWRSRESDEKGRTFCIAIDLKHFRAVSNGETLHGIERVACPSPSGL